MLVSITLVSKFHNTLIKPFLNFFKQQVFLTFYKQQVKNSNRLKASETGCYWQSKFFILKFFHKAVLAFLGKLSPFHMVFTLVLFLLVFHYFWSKGSVIFSYHIDTAS